VNGLLSLPGLFQVILVARSADKLAAVAEQVKRVNPAVQCEVIAADLCGSVEEYDRIARLIAAKTRIVSILINNAGGTNSGVTRLAVLLFPLTIADDHVYAQSVRSSPSWNGLWRKTSMFVASTVTVVECYSGCCCRYS